MNDCTKLSLVALGVIIPSLALGQTDKDIATCAAMQGDLDRLSCFDDFAKSSGLDAPQPSKLDVADTGKWDVRRSVNPIDDSARVILSLTADQGTSRWGDEITFIARCQSNSTEAYIIWHDYLGDDSRSIYNDYKNVTVRIGAATAEVQQWGLSTDNIATFAPSWAGSLLKRMAQSNSLIVQVTPYNESPVTAIFDTTGMQNALIPLMEECGWQL